MTTSYWVDSSQFASPKPIALPDSAEVCVVGAGIVGLTVAVELAELGHRVVVVDADDIGFGVTGQATAKVTIGTGLRLDDIAARHGKDIAQQYLDAGRVGFDWVSRHIPTTPEASRICEHELYATTDDGVDRLKAHVELVREFGVTVADRVGGPIPRAIFSVSYPEQCVIQPVDYLRNLARYASSLGVKVVTNTVVKRVKAVKAGKAGKRTKRSAKGIEAAVRSSVVTDHGNITAEHVIIATHVPLGRIPALLPWEQRRHHMAVIEVDADAPMSYDIGNGWSTRPAPRGDGQRPRAVVVGGRHAIGDDDSHYARELRRWATTEMSGIVIGQWSTQDVFTDDELPIVGGVKPRDNVLTATGFGGWGFAHGTAAGIDLAQRVHTGEDRWDFWSPSTERLTKLIPQATKRGVQTSAGLVADRIKHVGSHVDDADIEPGQGVIIREGTSYVAKSRDQDGRLAAVNATCTHMGCLVSWNHVAQSWDCPCHGSRYDRYGHVLHGPATKSLERMGDGGIDLAAGTEVAWDR